MKIKIFGRKASGRDVLLKTFENLQADDVNHIYNLFKAARVVVRNKFCTSRHLFGWGLKKTSFWLWAAAHSVRMEVTTDDGNKTKTIYFKAPYLEKIQERMKPKE